MPSQQDRECVRVYVCVYMSVCVCLGEVLYGPQTAKHMKGKETFEDSVRLGGGEVRLCMVCSCPSIHTPT